MLKQGTLNSVQVSQSVSQWLLHATPAHTFNHYNFTHEGYFCFMAVTTKILSNITQVNFRAANGSQVRPSYT